MDRKVYFELPKLSAVVSFDLDERYDKIDVKNMTKEEEKDITEKVMLVMESSARMVTEEEYLRLAEKYSKK